MSGNPFPVFYQFSTWRGNITGGPNATTVSQNPLTFSINSPSSLAVSFKVNLLGIIIIVVVVVVAVVSVLLFRRRNAPQQESEYALEGEQQNELGPSGTIDTIENP